MSCGNPDVYPKINLRPQRGTTGKEADDLNELSYDIIQAIRLLITARSNGKFTQSLEDAICHIENELKKRKGGD